MSSIRDLDQEVITEMSVVDIAYHILKESGKEPKSFQEIVDEIVKLRGLTKEQIMEIIPRVYTEMNIDGRFKALGDNVWGLRSWYPVEQAEEIVITPTKTKTKKKKKKKLDEDEAFIGDELDELNDGEDDAVNDVEDLDDVDYNDEDIDEDLDEDEVEALDEDLDELDETINDDDDLNEAEDEEEH